MCGFIFAGGFPAASDTPRSGCGRRSAPRNFTRSLPQRLRADHTGKLGQHARCSRQVVANSLRWLIGEYYKRCAMFKSYDEETKKVRRNLLTALCEEPVIAGQRQADRRSALQYPGGKD